MKLPFSTKKLSFVHHFTISWNIFKLYSSTLSLLLHLTSDITMANDNDLREDYDRIMAEDAIDSMSPRPTALSTNPNTERERKRVNAMDDEKKTAHKKRKAHNEALQRVRKKVKSRKGFESMSAGEQQTAIDEAEAAIMLQRYVLTVVGI